MWRALNWRWPTRGGFSPLVSGFPRGTWLQGTGPFQPWEHERGPWFSFYGFHCCRRSFMLWLYYPVTVNIHENKLVTVLPMAQLLTGLTYLNIHTHMGLWRSWSQRINQMTLVIYLQNIWLPHQPQLDFVFSANLQVLACYSNTRGTSGSGNMAPEGRMELVHWCTVCTCMLLFHAHVLEALQFKLVDLDTKTLGKG